MTHTTNDAPVTVEQACERIQRWMDDEHRTLSPGETGAELTYDDVTIVLRAARLAALASAPAGDGVEEARAIILQHSEKWVADYVEREHELPDTMVFRLPFVEKLLADALSRPRAAVGEQSREAIARIIAPHEWQRHDEILANLQYENAAGQGLQRAAAERLTEPSRIKADAILALQSPPAKVEGEREAGRVAGLEEAALIAQTYGVPGGYVADAARGVAKAIRERLALQSPPAKETE